MSALSHKFNIAKIDVMLNTGKHTVLSTMMNYLMKISQIELLIVYKLYDLYCTM